MVTPKRTLGLFLLVVVSMGFASASVLSDAAASLQPGTLVELPHTQSIEAFQAPYSLLYYGDSAVWNPLTKKVQWIGSGGTCCTNGQYYLLTYDEAMDAWNIDNAPFIGSGHAYDGNALNPATGMHYFARFQDEVVHTWDGTNWATLPALPFSNTEAVAVWFPDLNQGNGGLVFLGTDGKWAWYDGTSWNQLPDLALSGYHGFAEYNPRHKVVWMGMADKTYRVDSQRNPTLLSTAPFDLNANQALKSVDPVSGKYIVIDKNTGSWWEFDIMADTWTELTSLQGSLDASSRNLLHTPIADHGVIFFYYHDADETQRKAYLYKHAQQSEGAALINSLAPGEWKEIPGSSFSNALDAGMDPCPTNDCSYSGSRGEFGTFSYGGGAYDSLRNRYIAWGGGHGDNGGNEVYVFDVPTLSWQRLSDPSDPPAINTAYASDGGPVARHTYDNLEYLPALDAFCSPGHSAGFNSGSFGTQNLDCFDFSTNTWLRKAISPVTTGNGIGPYTAVDAQGNLWSHSSASSGSRYEFAKYTPQTDTWTTPNEADLELFHIVYADKQLQDRQRGESYDSSKEHWWHAEAIDTRNLIPQAGATQSITFTTTLPTVCASMFIFDKDINGWQNMGPMSNVACA